MTEEEFEHAVFNRFATEMDVVRPGFLYALPNKRFVEPPVGTPFARLQIVWIDDQQHTLGKAPSRQWERLRDLYVHVFVPVNDGTKIAAQIIQDIRTIFEGVSFDGITPREAVSPRPVGSDGKWYEVAVVVPLTYYESR